MLWGFVLDIGVVVVVMVVVPGQNWFKVLVKLQVNALLLGMADGWQGIVGGMMGGL